MYIVLHNTTTLILGLRKMLGRILMIPTQHLTQRMKNLIQIIKIIVLGHLPYQ